MNSFHTHSKWSDGENTIREMALEAKARGLLEFGISDHLVLAPQEIDASDPWWIPRDRLAEYVTEAQKIKAELSDGTFKMYVGVEADFFPETIDCLREMLALYDFDYVIGAVHYAGAFPVDHSAKLWHELSPEQQHEIWKIYLEKLTGLCRSRCFDWLAHIDLPKKFDCQLPEDLRPMMAEAIREVAEAGMAIELNTAGLDKPCCAFYPENWILELAVEQAVPVALTADAHAVGQLTRYFDKGMQVLGTCGIEPVNAAKLFGHRRI